jgi:hypothetical protein
LRAHHAKCTLAKLLKKGVAGVDVPPGCVHQDPVPAAGLQSGPQGPGQGSDV